MELEGSDCPPPGLRPLSPAALHAREGRDPEVPGESASGEGGPVEWRGSDGPPSVLLAASPAASGVDMLVAPLHSAGAHRCENSHGGEGSNSSGAWALSARLPSLGWG